MAVGKIKEKPVVKNGEICIVPVLPIAATFDHRVVDGGHISKMVKVWTFTSKTRRTLQANTSSTSTSSTSEVTIGWYNLIILVIFRKKNLFRGWPKLLSSKE